MASGQGRFRDLSREGPQIWPGMVKGSGQESGRVEHKEVLEIIIRTVGVRDFKGHHYKS